MERLTTRNSEGVAVLKVPHQCERCGEETYRLSDYGNGEPIEKLARYEDLQEQGRLPELPCAVGKLTYDASETYGKVVAAIVKKIEIDADGLWVITSSGTHSFDDFGKTVFLTKESAEEVLKRMEDGK